MNKFVVDNRKNVFESLQEDNVISILFSGKPLVKSCDQFFPFEPNRNFYYLTGIDEPHLILLTHKNGSKIIETLFIERYDELRTKWDGKILNIERAKELSSIEDIKYLDEFDNNFAKLVFNENINTIYLDLENRYLDSYKKSFEFANILKNNYPYIDIKNIYNNIGLFRLIKKPFEIDAMRKAINVTKQGIENIMKNISSNMNEYEAEAYFDFTLKSNNCRKSFNTILACGANAATLHYTENDSKLEETSLVLLDLGAEYNYYSADISRTIPVNGKFTNRQKELYNIVLEAQFKVIENIKEGITIKELNNIVIDFYEEKLKEIGLIKDKSEVSNYYFHSIGHYLGLDTHDVSRTLGVDTGLKAGMVITVEPGLYISQEGIGIRIEDDILVTKDGYENLSKDIIKTVAEIEHFFANR